MFFRIVAILSVVAGVQAYDKIGEYMPVSNVLEHSQMMEDVNLFVAALKEKPPNYALAMHIYENGGGESCKSETKPRTLHAFAVKDLSAESWGAAFYGTGLSKTWWDDLFHSGLHGDGAWGSLDTTARSVSLQKMAMGLMTWYASHELEAAVIKAKDVENRVDTKAPHAWDEGWAFYYGTDAGAGKGSPWEVAKKRDGDFCADTSNGCLEVTTGIVPHFNSGLIAVRKDTYDNDKAVAHMNVIYKMWIVTYMRAALKYLSISEKSYDPKPHAEGFAYWLPIAGWVASICKDEANAMTEALKITQTSIPAGTYCKTKKMIEGCYKKLGISCKLVGTYKDEGVKGVKCEAACEDGGDVELPDGAAAVDAVDGTNPADTKCKKEFDPSAPAPTPSPDSDSKDASSAVIASVGLATLGLSSLLHM